MDGEAAASGFLDWMYWTWPSAIGFLSLAGLLAMLTVADVCWPSYPRKGLLPMTTTRGDRVFLGIACFLLAVFVWLKIAPEAACWWPVGSAAVVAVLLLVWG